MTPGMVRWGRLVSLEEEIQVEGPSSFSLQNVLQFFYLYCLSSNPRISVLADQEKLQLYDIQSLPEPKAFYHNHKLGNM